MEGVIFQLQSDGAGKWRWVLWPPPDHTGGAMVSGFVRSRGVALADLERFRAAVAAAAVVGGDDPSGGRA